MSIFDGLRRLLRGRSGPARNEVPATEAALTEMMAERFRAAFPDYGVSIVEPLLIELRNPAGGVAYDSLDRLWTACRLQPDMFHERFERYASAFIEMETDRQALPERSALRLVIREQRYVDGLRAKGEAAGQGLFVGRPLVGELWTVLAADRPNSINIVTEATLDRLGWTVDDAFADAQRNLEAMFTPVGAFVPAVPVDHIGALGNDYDPSRLLLHDQWADLAARAEGGLLVAVPCRNLLLFAAGARAGMMRESARESFADTHAPLSETILRWTPAGWQVFD